MKMTPTLRYLIATMIYGTIGFFVHYVNASSEFVVMCRGLLGSLFIITVMLFRNRKPNINAIKKNLLFVVFSGIALGLNWIFLFAGYEYGVAVTSLCNYMAPIIVLIISAIFYKEKLSISQIVCVLLALVGIVMISGIFEENSLVDIHCVIYGLLAAVGFVFIVLCNRKIKDIDPLDKTVVQLFFSFLTVLPYVLYKNSIPNSLDIRSLLLLLLLGIVHTGIAYIFYFNSVGIISSDKVAIIGCIEPVMILLTGVFIFHEKLSVYGLLGAVLILVSALFNELFQGEKK